MDQTFVEHPNSCISLYIKMLTSDILSRIGYIMQSAVKSTVFSSNDR